MLERSLCSTLCSLLNFYFVQNEIDLARVEVIHSLVCSRLPLIPPRTPSALLGYYDPEFVTDNGFEECSSCQLHSSNYSTLQSHSNVPIIGWIEVVNGVFYIVDGYSRLPVVASFLDSTAVGSLVRLSDAYLSTLDFAMTGSFSIRATEMVVLLSVEDIMDEFLKQMGEVFPEHQNGMSAFGILSAFHVDRNVAEFPSADMKSNTILSVVLELKNAFVASAPNRQRRGYRLLRKSLGMNLKEIVVRGTGEGSPSGLLSEGVSYEFFPSSISHYSRIFVHFRDRSAFQNLFNLEIGSVISIINLDVTFSISNLNSFPSVQESIQISTVPSMLLSDRASLDVLGFSEVTPWIRRLTSVTRIFRAPSSLRSFFPDSNCRRLGNLPHYLNLVTPSLDSLSMLIDSTLLEPSRKGNARLSEAGSYFICGLINSEEFENDTHVLVKLRRWIPGFEEEPSHKSVVELGCVDLLVWPRSLSEFIPFCPHFPEPGTFVHISGMKLLGTLDSRIQNVFLASESTFVVKKYTDIRFQEVPSKDSVPPYLKSLSSLLLRSFCQSPPSDILQRAIHTATLFRHTLPVDVENKETSGITDDSTAFEGVGECFKLSLPVKSLVTASPTTFTLVRASDIVTLVHGCASILEVEIARSVACPSDISCLPLLAARRCVYEVISPLLLAPMESSFTSRKEELESGDVVVKESFSASSASLSLLQGFTVSVLAASDVVSLQLILPGVTVSFAMPEEFVIFRKFVGRTVPENGSLSICFEMMRVQVPLCLALPSSGSYLTLLQRPDVEDMNGISIPLSVRSSFMQEHAPYAIESPTAAIIEILCASLVGVPESSTHSASGVCSDSPLLGPRRSLPQFGAFETMPLVLLESSALPISLDLLTYSDKGTAVSPPVPPIFGTPIFFRLRAGIQVLPRLGQPYKSLCAPQALLDAVQPGPVVVGSVRSVLAPAAEFFNKAKQPRLWRRGPSSASVPSGTGSSLYQQPPPLFVYGVLRSMQVFVEPPQIPLNQALRASNTSSRISSASSSAAVTTTASESASVDRGNKNNLSWIMPSPRVFAPSSSISYGSLPRCPGLKYLLYSASCDDSTTSSPFSASEVPCSLKLSLKMSLEYLDARTEGNGADSTYLDSSTNSIRESVVVYAKWTPPRRPSGRSHQNSADRPVQELALLPFPLFEGLPAAKESGEGIGSCDQPLTQLTPSSLLLLGPILRSQDPRGRLRLRVNLSPDSFALPSGPCLLGPPNILDSFLRLDCLDSAYGPSPLSLETQSLLESKISTLLAVAGPAAGRLTHLCSVSSKKIFDFELKFVTYSKWLDSNFSFPFDNGSPLVPLEILLSVHGEPRSRSYEGSLLQELFLPSGPSLAHIVKNWFISNPSSTNVSMIDPLTCPLLCGLRAGTAASVPPAGSRLLSERSVLDSDTEDRFSLRILHPLDSERQHALHTLLNRLLDFVSLKDHHDNEEQLDEDLDLDLIPDPNFDLESILLILGLEERAGLLEALESVLRALGGRVLLCILFSGAQAACTGASQRSLDLLLGAFQRLFPALEKALLSLHQSRPQDEQGDASNGTSGALGIDVRLVKQFFERKLLRPLTFRLFECVRVEREAVLKLFASVVLDDGSHEAFCNRFDVVPLVFSTDALGPASVVLKEGGLPASNKKYLQKRVADLLRPNKSLRIPPPSSIPSQASISGLRTQQLSSLFAPVASTLLRLSPLQLLLWARIVSILGPLKAAGSVNGLPEAQLAQPRPGSFLRFNRNERRESGLKESQLSRACLVFPMSGCDEDALALLVHQSQHNQSRDQPYFYLSLSSLDILAPSLPETSANAAALLRLLADRAAASGPLALAAVERLPSGGCPEGPLFGSINLKESGDFESKESVNPAGCHRLEMALLTSLPALRRLFADSSAVSQGEACRNVGLVPTLDGLIPTLPQLSFGELNVGGQIREVLQPLKLRIAVHSIHWV